MIFKIPEFMKILLLEDNTADAELTIRTLKKTWTGCTVKHIVTIREAKEILAGKPEFDIALLDMQLPDGSGMDVLIEIRQKKLDLAVAMLTGSGDEEVAVAALKAGADDYTVKHPGYTDKVPQTVELALENYRKYSERASDVIHVLYIEHNAADVDLTRRHLMRYAPFIRITNVPSAEKALELLPGVAIAPGDWNYQLVLMDYRLPGMNALEIIKEIRQERHLDIPILIVTGHGNEEVAVQALKIGASDYLVKRENYLTRLPSLITSAFQHCELFRKQKALAESEAKYRLLAENSGDVIFTLDFDLNYTYISPAIYSMRGFTPEDIVGRKISEILTPASFKKVKEIFQGVLPKMQSGKVSLEPMVIELETLKKNGTTIWVEVKVSVSFDAKGNPVGILGVSRDVSKRKGVQEELRKLSQAVVQSPVSITITDIDGNIEFVNPQFTKLTGYTPEEVKGRNPRILKSGKQPAALYKELWDNILSGKEWHGELENKKKNGELYWVSESISPLVDEAGEITHFVSIKEDITERKRMLHDLIEAKEKSEAADRLKTAFLNNISHEVRTPLNGILGFGQFLVQPDLTQIEKEQYLKILQKSSYRLIKTITSFMDISLITSGNMPVLKKMFPLQPWMNEVNELVEPLCREKELNLQITPSLNSLEGIKAVTDAELLKKVFVHLLDNAIKFTNQGTVSFGCLVKDETLYGFVEDTGVGIDASMLKTVFKHFTQENPSTSRGHEGSGLGLSIAKGLVELLGGEISLESEKGKGTRAQFSVPV